MDVNTLTSQIAIVVLFFVPGSIYLWTYERFVGRLALTGTERLLRAVTMSAIVYAFFSVWLVRLATRSLTGNLALWEGVAAGLILLLGAPFVLGIGVSQVRRRGLTFRWLGWLTSMHPAPTAWDFAFEGAGGAFLRMKLKNGTFVGGTFGEGSFASSYPEPPSVFLERAWHLDEEGRFVEPLDGSRGLYIGLDDVESVEWLEVRDDVEGQ